MKVPIQVSAVVRNAVFWPARKNGLFGGIAPQAQGVVCNGVQCQSPNNACCPADSAHASAYCAQCGMNEVCCNPNTPNGTSACQAPPC
jgi:hypothetical protein